MRYQGQHIRGPVLNALLQLKNGEVLVSVPLPEARHVTVQKRAHNKAKRLGIEIRSWYSGTHLVIARRNV